MSKDIKKDIQDDGLLDRGDVACVFRVSNETVGEYVRRGILPKGIQLVPGGPHKWKSSVIAAVIDKAARSRAPKRPPRGRLNIGTLRVIGEARGCTCIQCHSSDGQVFKIKDGRIIGSKTEPLHKECAGEWFAALRAQSERRERS
jgi:hypothetical protein